MPSNTLARLYGLAAMRRAAGPRAGCRDRVTAIDETNKRVVPDADHPAHPRADGGGPVGLVGVQTNQYPARA